MLDFKKANFSVLRRLVSEALKLKGIGELGVQEECSFLKGVIL